MSQESRNGFSQQHTGTRRNIRIGKRRTSVKLEPEMWEALIEIGFQTKKTINQICTEVHKASFGADQDEAANGANFTSDLRVFILDYYRAIAR